MEGLVGSGVEGWQLGLVGLGGNALSGPVWRGWRALESYAEFLSWGFGVPGSGRCFVGRLECLGRTFLFLLVLKENHPNHGNNFYTLVGCTVPSFKIRRQTALPPRIPQHLPKTPHLQHPLVHPQTQTLQGKPYRS